MHSKSNLQLQDRHEDLQRRAKLPSLYNRRLQYIVILMYKVRNGLAPDYIDEIFNTAKQRLLLKRLSLSDRQRQSLDNFMHHLISNGILFYLSLTADC